MDRQQYYAHANGDGTLDYELYLNTKALLSCQKEFADFCNHDELQFQTVHQVEELWMKLIGYTLLDVDDYLQAENTNRVVTLMRRVLIAVRLPRVLAAFGVGSLLALSGVLLQALFRNSLADPYVLGVSGGAAVGALLAMIAGAAALIVQSAAVAGALSAVALVYLLARGGGTPRLLLTGVVFTEERRITSSA